MRINRTTYWLSVACMLALSLLAFNGVARARQAGASREEALANIERWGKAFRLYAQDYDEILPTFQSDSIAEAKVQLYHGHYYDNRSMRSPVNGAPYHVNPRLNGLSSYAIEGPLDAIPILTETVASFGSQPLIVAFDNNVYQGGKPTEDSITGIAKKAKSLAMALNMYAQDYDESLPQKMDNASLKGILGPYLRSLRPFTVSASTEGVEFVFNTALAGKSMSSFPDLNAVPAVSLPKALQARFSVLATLEGRVYIKGQEFIYSDFPAIAGVHELQQARVLSIAIMEYALDHDERLPNLSNRAVFQQQILPYLPSPAYLATYTGKDYVLNPAFSEMQLAAIENISDTELFRDPDPLFTGKQIVGYADGYAKSVRR